MCLKIPTLFAFIFFILFFFIISIPQLFYYFHRNQLWRPRAAKRYDLALSGQHHVIALCISFLLSYGVIIHNV